MVFSKHPKYAFTAIENSPCLFIFVVLFFINCCGIFLFCSILLLVRFFLVPDELGEYVNGSKYTKLNELCATGNCELETRHSDKANPSLNTQWEWKSMRQPYFWDLFLDSGNNNNSPLRQSICFEDMKQKHWVLERGCTVLYGVGLY